MLSGVLSGGLGTLARGGAMAVGWGTRAARASQVAAELGAFVPTERVLRDVVGGQRADWSPGALGRDYALTLGGYGLFRALGRGWEYFRAGGPTGSAGLVTPPPPAPLGASSVVLDSNIAIAVERRAAGLPLSAGEQAMVRWVDNLPAGTQLRATASTFTEVSGARAAYRGVEVTVDRAAPEYANLYRILEQGGVGRAKGTMDRYIVADTFFARTEPGVLPTLATHDKGVYNRLLRLSGVDPARLGRPVSEVYPNGFNVTIDGRTIRVIPLRPE